METACGLDKQRGREGDIKGRPDKLFAETISSAWP